MNSPLDQEQFSKKNLSEINEASKEKQETPAASGDSVESSKIEKSPENILPETENGGEGETLNVPQKEEDQKNLSDDYSGLTRKQILDRLSEISDKDDITDSLKTEADDLKQVFYKKRRTEVDAEKKKFIEEGGEEASYLPEKDDLEDNFKGLLQKIKEKRASYLQEEDKVKEKNLSKKESILEEIKKLTESHEDFYKVYNEFKNLQQKWKEIKSIPQEEESRLWKEYQHYCETFYDLVKINNEMRDYDFKKNLELKTALCEAAERLDSEPDVVSAFYQLQKLHEEWREIGPVARDIREDIWNRFKSASTVINKKHQAHFENLRTNEANNLKEKTSICEEIEGIDFSGLTNFKTWEEANKKVLDLQAKWRTIGFAPKKHNVKVFERYRAACDNFFQKKSEFYKKTKDSMDENLEKKNVLCEKAESMKDSTDWAKTTESFVEIQKEWKTIGPVARKYSDAIWKRFIAACDYFFEQKHNHFNSQKEGELSNLEKKKNIIENIRNLDPDLSQEDSVTRLRELMNEWSTVGYVPYKEKDKVYKDYDEALDNQFQRLKVDESEKKLQSFKMNIAKYSSEDRSYNKLLNERDKLMRNYDRVKNDINTYENNIGFLSVSSKGGSSLVKEMNKKIESLKSELDLIQKRISIIDENLDAENK